MTKSWREQKLLALDTSYNQLSTNFWLYVTKLKIDEGQIFPQTWQEQILTIKFVFLTVCHVRDFVLIEEMFPSLKALQSVDAWLLYHKVLAKSIHGTLHCQDTIPKKFETNIPRIGIARRNELNKVLMGCLIHAHSYWSSPSAQSAVQWSLLCCLPDNCSLYHGDCCVSDLITAVGTMEIAVFPTWQLQFVPWRLMCFLPDNYSLYHGDWWVSYLTTAVCCVSYLTTAVCTKEIAMYLGGLQIQLL
jgi:hypothetical protein